MPRLLQRLRSSFTDRGFRGPVLTLLSGSAVVLALSYLAQPILTRLYDPEAFGVADYFVMLMSVLTTVASLRYEDAIMTPEDDEGAAGVWWLSLLLAVFFTGLLVGLLPWSDALATWMGVPGLGPWFWLVPITLLAMRLSKLAELWLTRARRFKQVTGGQVAGSLSMVVTRLGAGVPPLSAGAEGLMGGFTAAQFASGWMYGRALDTADRTALRLPPRTALRSVAVRFRRFPLFSMPSALLNALVRYLPTLLIPLYFDAATLGLYGRAFIVLAVPLGLVGNAVAQVFFVHAAEAHREGGLGEMAATVHSRLVMLGVFPALLLVLAGPDLFAFVFGDDWQLAGVYAQYTAPWLLLTAVAAPLTRIFDVTERQRADLATSVIMFAVQGIALVWGGRQGDVLFLLLVLGIAGSATRLLHIGVMLRIAGTPARRLLQPYLRYAALSLPLLVPVWGLQTLGRPWLTTIGAAAMLGVYLLVAAWRGGLLPGRNAGMR